MATADSIRRRDAAVAAAGHDVPKAGTLTQISYCARCGAAYDSTEPCIPDGREAERRNPK